MDLKSQEKFFTEFQAQLDGFVKRQMAVQDRMMAHLEKLESPEATIAYLECSAAVTADLLHTLRTTPKLVSQILTVAKEG